MLNTLAGITQPFTAVYFLNQYFHARGGGHFRVFGRGSWPHVAQGAVQGGAVFSVVDMLARQQAVNGVGQARLAGGVDQ